jgi:hypothetical protein
MKRRPSLFLLFCLCASLFACVAQQGQPLTPDEVSQNGSHHFDASPDRTFEASLSALKAQGYEIADSNKKRGSIITKPKLVRAVARGTQYTAQAVELYRRYRLNVSSDGRGAKVVAGPSVFVGSRDISADPVWDIDGPMGERNLWAQLFREIQQGL